MTQIELTERAIRNIHKGIPLILPEDIVDAQSIDNGIVTFVDKTQLFVASGYLGKQNKGIGWVLSTDSNEIIDFLFVSRKLKTGNEKRRHFFNNLEKTSCFRLFNGESDGIGGMTIDYYNNQLVVSWYNETIHGYSVEIIEIIKEIFPAVQGIYEKIRFKDDLLPESRCVYQIDESSSLVTKENNVNFAVYLDEGLMTGIFLDQRNVRKRLVDGLVKGKTVLNTFSYTGAFSVAAKVGGCGETTSVDLAKRSREKTEEQFEVNGFDPTNEKIYVMDIFDFFKYAKRKKIAYDCIILDPPSFARNKKKVFSVEKNYGTLVDEALSVLNKKGILIASTNSATLSYKKFRKLVEKSMEKNKRQYSLIASERLPDDFTTIHEFPESNYLKVLLYQVD